MVCAKQLSASTFFKIFYFKTVGPSSNESAEDIYIKELANLSLQDKYLTEEELENNKQNTVDNNFHLVSSFNKLPENEDSLVTTECKDQLFPVIYRKNDDDIMVQAKANFFTILSNDTKTLHDVTVS